jgi:hypothetical protein
MDVDTALLRNVRREFKVLEKKAKDSPTPDDILEMAGALRHLLIDEGKGLFQRGWDELKTVVSGMPEQPIISVIDLGGILDLELPHIKSGKTVALANDVTMANGVRVMAGVSYPGIISDGDLKKQGERLKRIWYKLSWYRDSVCMLLGPWQISRGTVIKYVANKLGGRHYDTNRQPENSKIREQKKSKIREQIYLVLDEYFDFYGDKPGPYNLPVVYGENGNALHAAILSMCQDLEESPDVQQFIAIVDKSLEPSQNLGFK